MVSYILGLHVELPDFEQLSPMKGLAAAATKQTAPKSFDVSANVSVNRPVHHVTVLAPLVASSAGGRQGMYVGHALTRTGRSIAGAGGRAEAIFQPVPHPIADNGMVDPQMAGLSADAQRISDALAQMAASAKSAGPPKITATMVRQIIRQRRNRDRLFPPEIFADPAWDILLDLTAARLESRNVSVTSLCLAAAVPNTTGLRWIRILTQFGMLQRSHDPGDARRVYIVLSDETFDKMIGWLKRFAALF